MSEKVFWSEAEKRLIARRAIEMQRKRPDLAGLPLLREAIKALPKHRQRRLVSLTQVPWFEESVQAEARLQAAEIRPEVQPTMVVYPDGDPYLPFFREIAEANRRTEAAVVQLIELHRALLKEVAAVRSIIGGQTPPPRRFARRQSQPVTNDQADACSLDDN